MENLAQEINRVCRNGFIIHQAFYCFTICVNLTSIVFSHKNIIEEKPHWMVTDLHAELMSKGSYICDKAFSGSKNLTIYGESGSYIENYAVEHNISFIDIESGIPSEPLPTQFTDVKSKDYFCEPVKWAVENGITSGTSETRFSPNDSCTRAQAVTFLWRAAGNPEPASSEMGFRDVKLGAYYEKAVQWAVENGITSGTSSERFSPNATCTRAQIVTFLYRAENSPDVSGSGSFSDVGADEYYTNAVKWAVQNDITTGTGNGKFSPESSCARGQIVTFLYRYAS